MAFLFKNSGRLPVNSDNVAIATKNLDAGIHVKMENRTITLKHAVLEGHRFAIQDIKKGESLMSWGMPFGMAITDIQPGDYVCNKGVLEALSGRDLDITLPDAPNFTDEIKAFRTENYHHETVSQVGAAPSTQYFEGFYRSEERGVGTRNFILILGTSSRVTGFLRHVERACLGLHKNYEQVDGIVGVAHTEGDDEGLNNRELVLRTLAGFVVHPNSGAVLIVDDGNESLTSRDIQQFLKENGYPVSQVMTRAISLKGAFEEPAKQAITIIKGWLPIVNQTQRTKQPVSKLKLALQCGGSDAFSGISGNPLAGWVARALIKQGGSANLAETDELVGAESYILKKVRSPEVARRFLATIERFVQRAERHGSSAAGNPSGGNKFRGLYNIYLKSLGAAMKKHPEVRLDEVIEYAEPMHTSGYYFMDSPGNDLESIAGQVASGCNLIYFVTGNGSITNFPFVPTVKIVTTSRRFELLSEDMDVNAGAYLDEVPMDKLGGDTLDLTLRIASGQKSAGEKAGHAQVQLWRNWRQPEDGESLIGKEQPLEAALLSAIPIGRDGFSAAKAPEIQLKGYSSPGKAAFERLGLILPTSLCAGQVARMAAERMNTKNGNAKYGVDRFVTLVHTEGCGASSGSSEALFMRTMHGHLTHPNIYRCLLLEHGCEKTHNDYFRNYLIEHGLDLGSLGWASIQMGGGIQKTLDHIDAWFSASTQSHAPKERVDLKELKIGLLVDQGLESSHKDLARSLLHTTVASGASVVVPKYDPSHIAWIQPSGVSVEPTLAYGQPFVTSGMHIMDSPSLNWQEIVTGLGASGVHLFLYFGNDGSKPGHPFIPMVQLSDGKGIGDMSMSSTDVDKERVLNLIANTLNGTYTTVRQKLNNLDFQVTRGLYGISL